MNVARIRIDQCSISFRRKRLADSLLWKRVSDPSTSGARLGAVCASSVSRLRRGFVSASRKLVGRIDGNRRRPIFLLVDAGFGFGRRLFFPGARNGVHLPSLGRRAVVVLLGAARKLFLCPRSRLMHNSLGAIYIIRIAIHIWLAIVSFTLFAF